MRFAIAVLLLVLFVSVAAANPLPVWPAVSLTFTTSGAYEPEIYPAPYTNNSVYLMVTCGQGDEETSISAISFAFGHQEGSVFPTGYASLISGAIIVGDWEYGITLSPTEPITTSQVLVARMDFLYMGVPGYITVEDHPDYPRSVITAGGWNFPYCLVNHAGIGQPHQVVDEYCWFCEPMNPVENASWGVIKALYR